MPSVVAAVPAMARLLVFISLALVPAAVPAQQLAPGAVRSLQVRPQIELVITQRSKVMTAAFDNYVYITNLTEKDLVVEEVTLILPGEFVAARKGQNFGLTHSLSNQLLKPGHQRVVAFPVAPLNHWTLSIRRLAFVPGEYDIAAQVRFKVPPEVAATEAIVVERVSLQPPLSSLIAGGLTGALLLGLFIGSYEWLKAPAPGAPANTFRDVFWLTVKRSAAGSVVAVISLILLQRLQGLELPITLTVTDFFGAIVLGLFAYKLGDWLQRHLSQA